MLSIGKLAAGQEAHYLGKVAAGIEDYYVGGGEAEGRWTGSGAAALGLDGKASSNQLGAMLAGKNPATGQPLQDREQTMSGPGFDLTFSAPKSVSLLWAFGDEQVRSRVGAAHEAAVDQARGHLERDATLARRGAGGGTFLPAPNLVGAAYRHRTSRAGDPQFHTHVLVSQLVKASNGRPSLYANAKTAGFLYQAELRDKLIRILGIEWGEVHRGSAAVEGIEEVAEATFSRSRSEIEVAQAASGTGSRASWQSSALETRKAKGAVGPGGLFRATYERHGVTSLPNSRRQKKLVDRHIIDLISTGHGTEALDLLRATNGVVVAKNGTDRDQALVADWWNSYSQGHDAVMIAQTNNSVSELNKMARALMAETGSLGTETIEAAGNQYATGDLVVTRVNDHHAEVRNLQRWQITEIDQEARELRLRSLDSPREATIGAAYLATPTRHDRPSIQHGYAVTGHVAQGTTRATVFAQAEAGIYQAVGGDRAIQSTRGDEAVRGSRGGTDRP